MTRPKRIEPRPYRRRLADGQWYTIRDATTDVEVTVRLPHCRKGIPRDDARCPAALAIKAMFRGARTSVGAETALIVYADEPDVAVRYVLSKADAAAVHWFDERGAFAPTTITLRAPTPRRALGARAGESPGSDTRTGRAHTAYNAPLRHLGVPA